MATYRSCVCVLLCVLRVYSVYSYTIRGTIKKNKIELPNEVEVSNYINGEDFNKVLGLTLNRLVDPDPLPTLTLANFKFIASLNVTNISLEQVPVFVNTSCAEIHITRTRIKSVPANAFSGPRPWGLNLNNNEIQSMADRSVNIGAGFLRLTCNQLTNFSQSWFQDPSTIFVVYLDGNRIEYIQDRAFDQMTRLSLLQLSYNRITSIGSEAFSSAITHLLLDFNGITQFSSDMFVRREIPLHTLYLHHNQLSFLPEALLVHLKPTAISLQGNPWQCECLRDIERWLREQNSTRLTIRSRHGEPVCVVPRNFVHVCIPVTDPELQQTYASGLSPVQGCLATPCEPCRNTDDYVILT